MNEELREKRWKKIMDSIPEYAKSNPYFKLGEWTHINEPNSLSACLVFLGHTKTTYKIY